MRNRKLSSGVSDYHLTTAGVKVAWCEELWDALDDIEPDIIGKIIEAIDDMNGGYGAGPFSQQARGRK